MNDNLVEIAENLAKPCQKADQPAQAATRSGAGRRCFGSGPAFRPSTAVQPPFESAHRFFVGAELF